MRITTSHRGLRKRIRALDILEQVQRAAVCDVFSGILTSEVLRQVGSTTVRITQISFDRLGRRMLGKWPSPKDTRGTTATDAACQGSFFLGDVR